MIQPGKPMSEREAALLALEAFELISYDLREIVLVAILHSFLTRNHGHDLAKDDAKVMVHRIVNKTLLTPRDNMKEKPSELLMMGRIDRMLMTMTDEERSRILTWLNDKHILSKPIVPCEAKEGETSMFE